MKGIVIAAGLGSRMGSYTTDRPKCMLPIAGRPLLHWTMDALRQAGCNEFVVIVGYKAEQVDAQGATVVRNEDFRNNNILHSLMCARDHLQGDVICSYSDIWIEPPIAKGLAATSGDIVVVTDTDWQPYYEGREKHPISEAENVRLDGARVLRMGKHLADSVDGARDLAEFIGLWRLSPVGCNRFRHHFDAFDRDLQPTQPFQAAREWRKAYITDMLTGMIQAGETVTAHQIRRGWAELDTSEDIERLPGIAERQSLNVLQSALRART